MALGTLLLIQSGGNYEIKNTGRVPLRTISVYVPPAFSTKRNEFAAGRTSDSRDPESLYFSQDYLP